IGSVRLVQRCNRPGLVPQPRIMTLRPRLLRAGKSAAVPQQKLREAVPGAQEIRADVLATAQEIAGRLFLLGGNMNRGEGASAIQHGELSRITAIRLDAIARPPRDQGG